MIKKPIEFNRADFDFFDLNAETKINGMMKQIRYFVFRYKEEVVYQK